MEHFVGIDVSLESCAVCVVNQSGSVVREEKVACEPEALITFMRELNVSITGIGLEAGPLSQWLHRHLCAAGLESVLMETRHVKGALKAMPIKTDRRDALGIAQLIRMGWFRPVHCKSVSAQELRALLGARRTLKKSMIGIELSMRGMLRGFGLKLGKVTRRRLPERAKELAAGNEMLTAMVTAMLRGHAGLRSELSRLENQLRRIARADRVVRLMMTVPGVGAIVALQVKAGIDDPARFRSSKSVGPHFGLTPRREQSGERDVVGAISGAGDRNVRTALFQAATVMLYQSRTKSWLKAWGMQIARRRGMKRAVVAVARRLAVVLHRMWSDGTQFQMSHPARTAIA